MKIAICTVGSTGDIQPYLALAVSLREAGHSLKIVSHPFHQQRFEQFGFEFAPCGPIVTQQELNEMLDKMLAMRNPLKQLELLMLEAFFADGESYFHSAKAALMGCDLAICHMVDFLGSEAAAQLGIPRIGGILAPAGIPTAFGAPPHLPNLGKWLNPLWWKAMAKVLQSIDRKAASFLTRVGGPSIEPKMYHVLAPELNLLACSPTLGPTFSDLPANIEVVGPWILKENAFTPKDDLKQFLENHPKPVIVSFGSMGGTKGPELTGTVLAALKLSGHPAVIQSGYSGLFAAEAPENVFFADFVPHEWLFARAGAVVHHAGAGTTTAVARAGVPHVPVVFIADQPYFAANLRRLGISTKMLWYHRMRPENLAKRLDEAMHSKEMQEKAKSLQPTILAEEGNARSVARIEKFMRDLKL